jgi:hypothetical protein
MWVRILFQIFEMIHLSNDNSDLKSIFTNILVLTRSSKLVSLLICFDKKKLSLNLSTLYTWVINGKCKKLSTLKFNFDEIFWPIFRS